MLADGFPRTALQVDFLKLLFDKLMALHGKHADGPDENRFPRPSFKVRMTGVWRMHSSSCNCAQHSCYTSCPGWQLAAVADAVMLTCCRLLSCISS